MRNYVVCLCLLLCLTQCYDKELWSLSLSIAKFNTVLWRGAMESVFVYCSVLTSVMMRSCGVWLCLLLCFNQCYDEELWSLTLSIAVFNTCSVMMRSYGVCLCLFLCFNQCYDEELWSLTLSIAVFNTCSVMMRSYGVWLCLLLCFNSVMMRSYGVCLCLLLCYMYNTVLWGGAMVSIFCKV